MAKLVLSFNGDVVKEFDLSKETMTIGRKPDNDVHIDNLAVSGHHAKILTILNDSFIEDLGSTNGTYIRGDKISKHALRHNDVIQIGKHELKYINEAAAEDEGEFEKTMIIRPDAAGMAEEANEDKKLEKDIGKIASDLAAAGAAGADGPGPAHLQLMSGANSGKELKLTKILTTLGKPGVQVAAITRRPTGYFLIVVDAGSSGSPTVNGAEVGKQGQPLNSGDVIEVAGVQMSFHLD